MISSALSVLDNNDEGNSLNNEDNNDAEGTRYSEKGVLQTFEKFTGKHLSWSNFLNKVAGLRSSILLKNRLQHSFFLKILQNF